MNQDLQESQEMKEHLGLWDHLVHLDHWDQEGKLAPKELLVNQVPPELLEELEIKVLRERQEMLVPQVLLAFR